MKAGYFTFDTIAAVATSLAGDAGVGIVRISGPQALLAAQQISRGFENPKPRYLHRITIEDPQSSNVLDDGLGVFFESNHSFTGEPVVELQLHGGRFSLQSVVRVLIQTGKCRGALPGEFSFRAVRNGKLSLSQAQAVQKHVSAKSQFEVSSARKMISSSRLNIFDSMAASLKDLLAKVELSIDFSDQDVEVISAEDIKKKIEALLNEARHLHTQMELSKRVAQGLWISFLGEPNAGKSTLFNAVLAEDRAIVSSEAGTTRDVITEESTIGPYFVRLADTAGIREAQNAVEQIGVSKSKNLIERSEIILLIHAATTALLESLKRLNWDSEWNVKTILVLNKWDLLSEESRKKALEEASSFGFHSIVQTAAEKGEGVKSLLQTIQNALDQKFNLGENQFLPSDFQLQMTAQLCEQLQEVLYVVLEKGINNPEVLSVLLHRSLDAISGIVGETTPDDVLEKIFREFCIGK